MELSIVVPVYGGGSCLPELVRVITQTMGPTGLNYEVILVNDFSPDNSWRVIEALCQQYPRVVGVDLRRNYGQDNAILTGIRLTRGEYIAIMDDDLQHHPKYLQALVAKADEGFDVVFADFEIKHQKVWKNLGSWVNGKLAELFLYKPKGLYLSPYKVIRRDVAALICQYSGPTPYIDGLLCQVTWRMASVPAEHQPRYAGSGNYGFWRSAGVSARLIFSFSVRPIRLVTWVGLITSCIALLAGAFTIAYRLAAPEAFPPQSMGWASLIVTVLLMGGIQLFFFGILGEYVGRTHLRVNDKPQTSVREVLNRSVDAFGPGRRSQREEVAGRGDANLQKRSAV
jgi:undecaprenyl-phosphate 4-deoxy-4-formamido-L-arabinose transferase